MAIYFKKKQEADSHPKVSWAFVILSVDTVAGADDSVNRVNWATAEMEVEAEGSVLEADLVGKLTWSHISASNNLVQTPLELGLARRSGWKLTNVIIMMDVN